MSLNLTSAEVLAGLKALAGTPWGDLKAAWGDRFGNLTEDLVLADDVAQIAAAVGAPTASDIDDGLKLLIALSKLKAAGSLGLRWIPPWDPAFPLQPSPTPPDRPRR